jgi:pimeloyl-ACP methyl ester carboxylesterase
LLLLHDGTGCYADWVYSGREQFEREYRLIIPDARGHGRSSFREQLTVTDRSAPTSRRSARALIV